ncbi:zinc transporter ZIP11 isoform X4 [Pseudophryne corroboree]|uniref:zinc transporter ZIP11 isoform X4 n=1 Tax=Pseudophryne corroboree TaxID=495146 RepID=UPI003081F243
MRVQEESAGTGESFSALCSTGGVSGSQERTTAYGSGKMIEGYNPMLQALLGTLFTWGLTAAGSALVFVFSTGQRRILDGSLGFAAGVMLAASYWSLLAPAIEMSSQYGSFSFLPAAIGFALGAGFVYFADLLLPALGIDKDPFSTAALNYDSKPANKKDEGSEYEDRELSIRIGRVVSHTDKIENGDVYQRKRGIHSPSSEDSSLAGTRESQHKGGGSWRRIMLLILAITIHNIPGQVECIYLEPFVVPAVLVPSDELGVQISERCCQIHGFHSAIDVLPYFLLSLTTEIAFVF